jgi:CRISPR-associated protein Csb2
MRLWLGRLGEITFERVEPGAADGAPWIGPAARWASVTPVALDRNPGDLLSRDVSKTARAIRRAEATIAEACTHIGLPPPAEIRVLRRSRFPGTPSTTAFAPYPHRPSRYRRVCVHVVLSFVEPVAGPVLVGVGRYTGVGLCRPALPPNSRAATGRVLSDERANHTSAETCAE